MKHNGFQVASNLPNQMRTSELLCTCTLHLLPNFSSLVPPNSQSSQGNKLLNFHLSLLVFLHTRGAAPSSRGFGCTHAG